MPVRPVGIGRPKADADFEADDPPRTHIRWWYEKDDFVLLFAPGEDGNPVVEALDGKTPSALKHPTYGKLEKLEAGEPVGRLFVDLSAFPPLPPRAHELGLDGIERVEARWGIQNKGVVVTLGVNAPRPRQGPRHHRQEWQAIAELAGRDLALCGAGRTLRQVQARRTLGQPP